VTELRRELRLLDAVMINVGTMVASAIFIVPATVAAEVRSPSLILLVWLAGGLVSLLGALCLAELGAALPHAGGIFVFLSRAYGPLWGFLYAWTAAVVINPASVAAIAVGFSIYLGFLVPLGPWVTKAAAVGSILALTLLNSLGLKLGARVQDALTLLKVAALVALAGFAFLSPGGSAANLDPFWPSGDWDEVFSSLGVAMVAVLWAYDGWIEITYVGGEVRDPKRTIPRCIGWSVGAVIVLYLIATAAYLYVLSPDGMARSSLVASDAALSVLGPAGAALVAGMIVLSTLGANNGIILTAARIPYAVSRAGLFFEALGRVHPRFYTPVAALAAQGVLAAILAASGTYQQLFTYAIFASWLFYAMSCAAVIRLRFREPHLERPYRVWGYPVTPVVFIAAAACLVIGTLVESPLESLLGALLIAVGWPVYRYWRRRRLGEDQGGGRVVPV
jgi:APA family basic amino acid/polyamine antiporter